AGSRELMLLVLIALLAGGMSVVYPNNFPTHANLAAVLLNAAQNGILVSGMMLLMIGGAFDLSIGSTVALAGVLAGGGGGGGGGRVGRATGDRRDHRYRGGGTGGRDQWAHRHPAWHQRADCDACHHGDLPRPDLPDRRHGRDADWQQLQGLRPDRHVRLA